MEKKTYFMQKSELPGSWYFEFQPGKYQIGGFFRKWGKTKLDSSIYLYYDECCDAMAILSYFITGSHPDKKKPKFFDAFGITYIDESDGKLMVERLHHYASLLEQGKTILEALGEMGEYDADKSAEWVKQSMKENNLSRERILAIEDTTSLLDIRLMKNTAEYLAGWAEKILAEYKTISILGI